ncbi:MAG: ABC transporter permease [Planctomycetota bacterium]|jgi:ribose/xylose/arabinose/galactoside ABC-type transport system permease subunit|nr:ABC transporter permease [Planctomycetota bacterium]
MTERGRDLRIYLPVYCIVLAAYVFAGWRSGNFFTWNNNVNLFSRVTPLILAGLAQTLVILTGGIDLSLGSMISVASVIAASLPYVDTPANLALWALVPPLAGLAMGCVNGLILAKWPFPPFIVTLASSSIYLGVALRIMREPGGEVSLDATWVSSGQYHGLPIPLVIMLAAVAISHLLLSRTRIGRSIYALGGNETLAVQSGISPGRVKFTVYALSGLFSGLAGTYLSAWMFAGDPLVGEPYVMNSIAVAVIGGTSLMGGRGGVVGVIGGAYIFYLINNILNLLGINAFYQYVAKGAILIAALAASAPGLLRRLGLGRRRDG